MVDQWNNDGGTEEQIWWNTATVIMEQWNSGTVMVEQWNVDSGTDEQLRWNSGTEVVEQWNRYGGQEEQ